MTLVIFRDTNASLHSYKGLIVIQSYLNLILFWMTCLFLFDFSKVKAMDTRWDFKKGGETVNYLLRTGKEWRTHFRI